MYRTGTEVTVTVNGHEVKGTVLGTSEYRMTIRDSPNTVIALQFDLGLRRWCMGKLPVTVAAVTMSLEEFRTRLAALEESTRISE